VRRVRRGGVGSRAVADNGGSATGAGAETDANDWRVTVRLEDEDQAGQAARHLRAQTVEAEVQRQLGGRVVVGTDGGHELFLYTRSQGSARTARDSVAGLLASHGMQAEYDLDRWHPIAEDWEPADVALPQSPAEVEAERHRLDAEETSESFASGVALFEVRVQLASHRNAVALADKLRAAGYMVVRRWRFLVVGADNADQADEFAAAIRQQAPAGAVITTEEVGPARPYTPFEIAAGSGL
jgi:hypothetical protein